LITGRSQSIGLAAERAFAAEGADLMLVARGVNKARGPDAIGSMCVIETVQLDYRSGEQSSV
jgi:NAD(P)-dependent dehydrogenase (short-subunit alcohol dehydrogenase family)